MLDIDISKSISKGLKIKSMDNYFYLLENNVTPGEPFLKTF